MYTAKDIFRDILLFSALAFLIICASDRLKTFISLHKNSLIHELDQGFADQLYSIQKQVRTLLQFIEHGLVDDSSLSRAQKIQKSLEAIEEKYTKNSPGILFLGPIGTTSIVLKEQQLSQKLLEQINELGKLLYEITTNYNIRHVARKEAHTIQAGIELNQSLLSALRQAQQTKDRKDISTH